LYSGDGNRLLLEGQVRSKRFRGTVGWAAVGLAAALGSCSPPQLIPIPTIGIQTPFASPRLPTLAAIPPLHTLAATIPPSVVLPTIPPPTPTPIRVMYVSSTIGLTIRQVPGIEADAIGALQMCTPVTLTGASRDVDGVLWYEVQDQWSADRGWVAAECLAEARPSRCPMRSDAPILNWFHNDWPGVAVLCPYQSEACGNRPRNPDFEGHYGIDIVVDSDPGATVRPTENGVPGREVYSPVEGTILSVVCPDGPIPAGSIPYGCTWEIEMADGRVVQLSHLMAPGYSPNHILRCPPFPCAGVEDARVDEGDFLGYYAQIGSSGQPHLHVSVWEGETTASDGKPYKDWIDPMTVVP
jgi:hypothetical protein